MQDLGYTRSVLQATHLVHSPDTFVRARLPGMHLANAIVHASPDLGAKFLQYTAELEPNGHLGNTSQQRFVWVQSGAVTVTASAKTHTLEARGYAYLPEGTPHSVAAQSASCIEVIEKPYESLSGVSAPLPLASHEDEVASVSLMNDEALQVRSLLPDAESFDFAVNTMQYQPGAALGMVEVHAMEHGLLMLEGGGIYRLANAWYPVKAGDFIWMAPYCPQWFGAIGKVPAKYLIYKNWNRSY